MNNKKVSVIILAYNNFDYMYYAINSVFSQKYENIELIISDDGSADFNKLELENYIRLYKNDKNIKNIIINCNSENLGTVKNMNTAIKLATGDYIIAFAADDVFHSNDVVSLVVKEFEKMPPEQKILVTQVAMYDQYLQNYLGMFIEYIVKKALSSGNNKVILEHVVVGSNLPSCGTIYRKSIFEEYGYFDESYKLVEDWPWHLKLLKANEKFRYFDIVSFSHRSGGVSHGNSSKDNKVSIAYDKDMLRCYEEEVLPILGTFNLKTQKKALKYYNYYKNKNILKLSTRKNFLQKVWLRKTQIASLFARKLFTGVQKIAINVKYLLIIGFLIVFFSSTFDFGLIMTRYDNLEALLKTIGLSFVILGVMGYVLDFIFSIFYNIYFNLRTMRQLPISDFLVQL